MLQLAAQGDQAMAVARLGLLGVQRLEQHDVAIEQPAHAADQAIAEPQQDEADPRQPDDRQDHPQKPERTGPPGRSGPAATSAPGRPPTAAGRPVRSSSIWWATNPNGSEARRSIRKWRRK